MLPTPVCLGFPCGSAGKESAFYEGDLGSIPGLGRSPGEGKCYPLRYSGLENSMDCIVHGVAESDLTNFQFHYHPYCSPTPKLRIICHLSSHMHSAFYKKEKSGID